MDVSQYFEERAAMVDVSLRDFIHARFDDDMMELVAYMATGGKRLRGVLTLLTCEAVEGTPENAMTAACAMELAHAASLAKDDFMDADKSRRGRPATWVKYGAKIAMLAPDIILPHAMEFVTEYGLRALHSVNMAWGKLTLGQMLDYPRPVSFPLAVNEYERIIGLKTAPLFQVACSLGVRASKKDWFLSVAEQYGYNTGMAFQIYDDAADLIQHMGDRWESVSKGKGLPMSIQALRARVGGGGNILEEDIANTFTIAEEYLGRAKEAAAAFPDTSVRSILLALPDYCCQAQIDEARESVPVAQQDNEDSEEADNASRLFRIAF